MSRDSRRSKSARSYYQPVVHDISRYTIRRQLDKSTDDDDALINIMKLVNTQKYTDESLERPDSCVRRLHRITSPVPTPRDAYRSASTLPPYQSFETPGLIQKRQVQKSARHRSKLNQGAIKATSTTIIGFKGESSLEDICLIPASRHGDIKERCQTPYRYGSARESKSGRYFDIKNGLCTSPRPYSHHSSLSHRPFTAGDNTPGIKVQKIKLQNKRQFFASAE